MMINSVAENLLRHHGWKFLFRQLTQSSTQPTRHAIDASRAPRRRLRRTRPPSTSPARTPNPTRVPPAKPRPTPPVSTPRLSHPPARASRRDIPCLARSPPPPSTRLERRVERRVSAPSRRTPRRRLGRILPNVLVSHAPTTRRTRFAPYGARTRDLRAPRWSSRLIPSWRCRRVRRCRAKPPRNLCDIVRSTRRERARRRTRRRTPPGRRRSAIPRRRRF